MRLGTCIALELAVAAGAVVGLGAGAARMPRAVEAALAVPEAHAVAAMEAEAIAAVAARGPIEPLPGSALRVVPPAAPPSVFGASDAALLAPLGAAPVARAKWNLGGSSVSLRLDFANGARAAFKPEQVHGQSDPRREIAAYRIDRLLGIGRVPPAKPIALPFDRIAAAFDPAVREAAVARLRDEAIVRPSERAGERGGVLRGELSWWIPEVRPARLGRLGVDEPEGRALWVSYLQPGAEVPAAARALVEQLAACVMFDVLVDNPDRWSGNNALGSPDGQTFYIMDNTMTFSLARIGHELNVGTLQRIRVFPRRLVARLRALTEDELVRALEVEPASGLGPLLSPDEVRAVLHRRDNLLAYIDGVIAAHGEAAVLALP